MLDSENERRKEYKISQSGLFSRCEKCKSITGSKQQQQQQKNGSVKLNEKCVAILFVCECITVHLPEKKLEKKLLSSKLCKYYIFLVFISSVLMNSLYVNETNN